MAVARRLKRSRATAMWHGRACGATRQWHHFVSNVVLKSNLIQSINLVRHGNRTTFETGLIVYPQKCQSLIIVSKTNHPLNIKCVSLPNIDQFCIVGVFIFLNLFKVCETYNLNHWMLRHRLTPFPSPPPPIHRFY